MTLPKSTRPLEIPDTVESLRQEVRAFLAERLKDRSGTDVGRSWTAFDKAFSREVGARGWIGMTWPKAYGGHDRSMIERYVVVEEMLVAGAPVGAHWVADRQSGPLLLRVGTEEQRTRFLPLIARGEAAFCIGLSEPNAGSDLASLRSKAIKVEGGWRLEGHKIWTTYARDCDFMIGLFRSNGSADQAKHQGLTQFLIDLDSSGIDIRPIEDLAGDRHFNEIFFDNVFVPDNMIVGVEGHGWVQANAELAFERSGPDRYLTSYPLLPAVIDEIGPGGDRAAARRIGGAVAELVALRQMSLSVLGLLDAGEMPSQEAALTKDLGTNFEQDLPELVRDIVDWGAGPVTPRLAEMMSYLTQVAPSFSLRGGTREIMRTIIARGLSSRG